MTLLYDDARILYNDSDYQYDGSIDSPAVGEVEQTFVASQNLEMGSDEEHTVTVTVA